MPRKSATTELQAEEAVASSPLRRSNRVVSGNGTAPASIITRRTSQTIESQADTPARATRARRASAQESEDKVDTKPVTRTRRASILAEEESRKETESTPSRRGRKPSITIEASEKEVLEKPKPLRSRRTSTASKNDESEEQKPHKTAPVRGRRSSANVEPEAEVKVAPKTPARTTSRRRSSIVENVVVDEVSTPAKRTTRGRKTSDTAETSEEVKNSISKGRSRSVNIEKSINEESDKHTERQDRNTSTDDVSENIAHKTVEKKSSGIQQANVSPDTANAEEEVSPRVLNDIVIQLTPLKKRKIVDKIETELDLSIINESSDDINSSTHNESIKERTEEIDTKIKENRQTQFGKNESIQSTGNPLDGQLANSPPVSSSKQDSLGTTPINQSYRCTSKTKVETLELSGQSLNKSARSPEYTPSSKQSLTSGIDFITSPRTSPRLSVKLSRHNSPKEERGSDNKGPTPRRSRNLIKENNKEINEKSQGSFISSGSDGSFKFHLSNVSMANSGRLDSNKENTQDDLLNTSKESTGSNKENIEITDSPIIKAALDLSVVIPVQESIVVARISNVFKPNQKDYSFMEPMEVEEDSMICPGTPVAETGINLENCSVILNQNMIKRASDAQAEFSIDDATQKSLNPDDSLVIFNRKVPTVMTVDKPVVVSKAASPNQQTRTEILQILESADEAPKQYLTETEGSDTNLLIEETLDTVDISIRPKIKKSAVSTTTIVQRGSKDLNSTESLMINQPLEQVKVILLGKSSSPIITKRRSMSFRKSRSPEDRDTDSTDSEKEQNRFSVGRPARRSKSISKTPSPSKELHDKSDSAKKHLVAKRFKSKSTSPIPARRLSNIKKDDVEQNHLSISRRSKSKSPDSRLICSSKNVQNSDALIVPRISNCKGAIVSPPIIVHRRSKSKSPSPRRNYVQSPTSMSSDDHEEMESRKSKSPIARDYEILGRRRSVRSKSRSPSPDFMNTPISRKSIKSMSKTPLPDSEDISIIHDGDKLRANRSVRSMSKSPLTDFQDTPVTQDGEKLRPRRSLSSKTNSFVPVCQESQIAEGNEKLKTGESIRSESKSPLLESTISEQSFENPKGAEEILVTSERKSMEPCNNAEKISNVEVQDTSAKDVPDDSTTNFSKITGSELEVSDLNYMQDRSTYHTAVATTNNESDCHSFVNTDNEVTQSQIKDSESTHYDFDLDSDDDNLLHSREGTPVIDIETSILDKQTLVRQKELQDHSKVIELRKSSKRKSVSPKEENKKAKMVKEDPKSENSNLVVVSTQIISSEPSKVVEVEKDDVFVKNGNSKCHENLTDSTKIITEKYFIAGPSNTQVKDMMSRKVPGIDKSNLEQQSGELIISSTVDIENKNQDSSYAIHGTNITRTEQYESVSKSTVAGTDDKKIVDKNFKGDAEEMYDEKDDIQEHSKSTVTSNISGNDLMNDDLVVIQEQTNKKYKFVEAEDNVQERSKDHDPSNISSKGLFDESDDEYKEKSVEAKNEQEECSRDIHVDLRDEDNPKEKEGEPTKHYKYLKEDFITSNEDTETFANAKPDKQNIKTESDPNMSIDISSNKKGDKKSETEKKHQGNKESKSNQKYSELDHFIEVGNNDSVGKKVNKDHGQESKLNVTDEDISSCKMAAKKVNISETTRIIPLDEFASSKLDEYLNSKAKELEESSSEEEESEREYHEFEDGMAEEGDEDTPSEDNNQIIDEGESIGFSSDREDTSDDYDLNDSFISDNEHCELLSGEEYDLEDKVKRTKKSRIIDISTLEDDDIIKISKKKKKLEKEKPKKRSRIITVSDDSSEEELELDDVFLEKEQSAKEDSEKVNIEQSSDGSVIIIEETKNEESSLAKVNEEYKFDNTSEPIMIDESKYENTSEAIITNKVSKIESSSKTMLTNKEIDERSNESVLLGNLNTSFQNRPRKSSLSIQENILIDGVKDPLITERINTLVESFCSTVKKGEIALNLSLEYEDSQGTCQEKPKTDAVHILSDIKICPNNVIIPQELSVPNLQKDAKAEESKLIVSVDEVADLKEVVTKNLKRKLSKSMDNVNEEIKAAKRRKKHKKNKDKQREKTTKTVTKTKKKDNVKVNSANLLMSSISSFGLINQLITDVNNRPKRVMKPTRTDIEVESSWTTTKVRNLKPSTTPVSRHEKMKIQPKLHPKDFKNQMLSDDKRVKRIDTKTLLKKKGAFY